MERVASTQMEGSFEKQVRRAHVELVLFVCLCRTIRISGAYTAKKIIRMLYYNVFTLAPPIYNRMTRIVDPQFVGAQIAMNKHCSLSASARRRYLQPRRYRRLQTTSLSTPLWHVYHSLSLSLSHTHTHTCK